MKQRVLLRTIHKLSLLVQPAPRHVMPPLNNDVVALQPASKIVPRRCYHCVFTLQIPDYLITCGLYVEETSQSRKDTQ